MIRPGMPTFIQGFLYGCLLAFSQILFGVLIILAAGSSVEAGYLTLFVVCIMLLITACMAFTFVGMKASERTGKVATGRNVAAWTGFCNSTLYFGSIFILLSSQIDTLRMRSQAIIDGIGLNFHYTNLFIIVTLLYMSIPIILLTVLAGFGFGTIGGRLGQKRIHVSGQPQ